MKTKQNNNMSDRTGVIYVVLNRKRNLVVITNQIECYLLLKLDRTMTWSLVQVQCTPKMILNCRDRSNWVPTMMKTKYDTYLTDHIDRVYAKNETELLWSIKPGMICDENQTG